jgi:hypothetical protein
VVEARQVKLQREVWRMRKMFAGLLACAMTFTFAKDIKDASVDKLARNYSFIYVKPEYAEPMVTFCFVGDKMEKKWKLLRKSLSEGSLFSFDSFYDKVWYVKREGNFVVLACPYYDMLNNFKIDPNKYNYFILPADAVMLHGAFNKKKKK